MATIVLNKIAQPQALSEAVNDSDLSTPLSFKDWIKNNIGIIPEDSQKQYERYLSSFYLNKNRAKTLPANQLREDYINLVKRLGIIFKNDEEFQRFTQINFESPTEIRLAIPYFAKKLKEVALFYVDQRENLKKTKLQYASIGSETGLERYLYNKLLNVFSHNIPLDSEDLQYLTPQELSDVKENFEIVIEELFEDENYFESSSSTILDINPLFCVLENEISSLCSSDDSDRLYISDPLSREYLCESDYVSQTELIAQGWNEYSSSDLFYISGGNRIPNIVDVNLSLAEDNNYFYWFSGETVDEIPQGLFGDVSLSSIDWSNATAGDNINSSDIIFASFGNLKTEAAWFMSADKITFLTEMTATMSNGKEFKFPYPGIGLSADGVWSGRTLTDTLEEDKQFFPNESAYLENVENIKKLYWSAESSISSIDSIPLQNLTLWDNGAYASKEFNNADKIIVRTNTGADRIHDGNPDEVYQGDLEIAWLYNFTKTQIPIIAETSNIYFPLTTFSDSTELSLKYNVGQDIPLSAVAVNNAFAGAIAGDNVSNSDFIVKKKTICGPELEAAWLSGPPLSAFRKDDSDLCVCDDDKFVTSTDWVFTKGVAQPALTFKVESNGIVKFVWTGPTTPISNVRGFNGFTHDATCPYHPKNKSLLEIDFKNFDISEAEEWRNCSCHAVLHSPIGQKSSNIDSFNIIPDLVLKEIDPFTTNLSEWRGRDNLPYNTSTDATWFQLSDSPDKDVGWGKGQWMNNFSLEQGQVYWYYRTNLNRCDIELPFFVINECYTEIVTRCDSLSNIPVWKKAIKDRNGEWVKTDEPTDLILSHGGLYDYTHRSTIDWEVSRVKIDGNYVTDEEFIIVSKNTDNYSFDVKKSNFSSVDFFIRIPLNDSKPYWGAASYENNTETRNKNVLRNYNDNRLIGEYLLTNQPIPSEIILTDNTTIRYELSDCNDCFIWKQPVTMNVSAPNKRWNKLLISECVQSEILDYLHNYCGGNCSSKVSCVCDSICGTTKTGVTATYEPADILFNTDLSGVPLFINYYARSPFDLNFKVEDLLNPVYAPILSGNILTPNQPWANLINDSVASFVTTQDNSNLRSRKETGVFVPSKIAIGKYELHSADSIYEPTDLSYTFRKDNYFDGPFSPINIDSRWMKNSIGLPSSNGYQTYHPYESEYRLGLYTDAYPTSPWDVMEASGCNVADLYANYVENVSANVIDWKTDIYGNQFFLTSGDNSFWIKTGDNISQGIETISSLFVRYTDEEIIELNQVNNINLFYDTLELVHTVSASSQLVSYNKLNWDYEYGKYNSNIESLYFDIGPLSASNRFIESFVDDKIKKAHIFTLSDQDAYFKIRYHVYDINAHNLKEIDITSEDNWETANLGTFDSSQTMNACYDDDTIDIVIKTTKGGDNILNIFTIDISNNSVNLTNVQKFEIEGGVSVQSIQRNSTGLFLLLNDDDHVSVIKLT